MTQKFRITGPGFYRTRGGEKAEVESYDGTLTHPWKGYLNGYFRTWKQDGSWLSSGRIEDKDIIGPWVEEQNDTAGAAYEPAESGESARAGAAEYPNKADAPAVSPVPYPCDCKAGLSLDRERSEDWICDECFAHWKKSDMDRLRAEKAVSPLWKPLFDAVKAAGIDTKSAAFIAGMKLADEIWKPQVENATELPEIKTLRDEMAMAALNGLLSASADITINGRALENEQDYAVLSYALADAMMEEREE